MYSRERWLVQLLLFHNNAQYTVQSIPVTTITPHRFQPVTAEKWEDLKYWSLKFLQVSSCSNVAWLSALDWTYLDLKRGLEHKSQVQTRGAVVKKDKWPSGYRYVAQAKQVLKLAYCHTHGLNKSEECYQQTGYFVITQLQILSREDRYSYNIQTHFLKTQ